MSRANGYFLAFVNAQAWRAGPEERALTDRITQLAREVLPGSQIHQAGSQRKGTAIAGSDLDLCLESREPVTEAQRRALRSALEVGLQRPVRVLSHCIRLPEDGGQRKVDLAFTHAAFGSRPLPDKAAFHDRVARQSAARALKIWSRTGRTLALPGWVVEAIVLHLDPNPGAFTPLELFLRAITWLDEKATPAVIEAVLRPAASPRWKPEWSGRLPGQLESLRNQTRALRRRKPGPEEWSRSEDVERWLRG